MYIKEDKYKGVRIISTLSHSTATRFKLVMNAEEIKSEFIDEYSNVPLDELENYWASGLESVRGRIDKFIDSAVKGKLNNLGFYEV